MTAQVGNPLVPAIAALQDQTHPAPLQSPRHKFSLVNASPPHLGHPSALSAAIMACSAALADAGIEQRDLLVGATVAVLGSADGPLVVDPTHEEMKLKVRGKSTA